MTAYQSCRALACGIAAVLLANVLCATAQTNAVKARRIEVAWIEDASKATAPDRTASGRLHGQPFSVDKATASPYQETSGKPNDPPGQQDQADGIMLKLQQGRESGSAPAFVIFCLTKSGKSVDGKTFIVPAGGLFRQSEKIMDKDGKGWFSPVGGVQVWWEEADGKSGSELLPKATMRLTFGKRKDGRLPGQIYLCIDDGRKTFVAGSFEAAVEEKSDR